MPELTFDKLDAIPEDLRGDAKQTDGGKFVVNVVSSKKLVEFRDNNINLSRERDELKQKYGAIAPLIGDDPTKFTAELTELRSTAQLVKDGKLKTSEAIETEVVNRSKAKTESLETQLRETAQKVQTLSEEAGGWRSKYEKSVLHQQITNVIVGKDSIANPEALPDIIARAERVFQVQPDGSIVPKQGDQVIYGSDGATPMSPKEWLTKLVAEAPYLGKPSAGGGANGGRDNGKKFGGLSEAEFNKLPPQERMRRAREAEMK